MMVAVLVIGIFASGKGTQAELLTKKYGLYHFVTSKEGKNYIDTHDDPETKRQLALYKKGILYESEWLCRVLSERVHEIFNEGKGVVFDGSPRTLYEAEYLLALLVELYGRENVKAIELRISYEEVKKRLEKRLVCSNDNSHSYKKSDVLQVGSPCPKGDGVLGIRDLDRPEVFDTRIDEFEQRTRPAIDFLKKNYGLVEVNGEQLIDDVHKDVVKALGFENK
ncbi:MAG: nucleoside monophosphate kinase [Candidatus Niyogibacteria bacterium]|nr:nucleoside monophosphate kinase [Candidatus Niyogibacteria bacterium]